MADIDAGFEFLAPDSFEWDPDKNELNRHKHGIDFDDATEVFYGPMLLYRSDRNDEERWIAVGTSHDRVIAVIFTRRNKAIRIISARRARRNEKRAYRNASMGRSAQGKE